MNKQLNALLLIVLLLFVGRESFAQWNTPTIETTVNIGANDYGTSNNNSYVVGGQTWFLTWDGTYLHGQLQDANETESAVIYLDLNPIVPINGGGNTNGNISGISFGGLGAPNLPFRADAVITFNNTDRRLYRANGSGGWTLVRSGLGGFGGGSDDVSDGFYGTTDRGDGPGANDDREFRITWNDLTGGGGLPSQFAWFGYVSYTNGLYAPVPERANPNGTYSAGAVLDFTYYMNVSSTVSGSSSNPMSQTSYTHLGGSVNFGGISIFDFTLNETGTTITRDNTSGGTWTIAGQLIIHDGTIDHNGTVNTDIVIDGNLVIGNNGSLILESTTPGADLYIGGDFTNNGTFNCNNRAVFFDGNGVDQAQTIRGDAGLTIDYMFVETTGDVWLDTTLTITQYLDLTNSFLDYHVVLNDNLLTMQSADSILNAGGGSFIVTNGTGELRQNGVGPGGRDDVLFPIGPNTTTYAPVIVGSSVSGAVDDYAFRVCGDVRTDGSCSGGSPVNAFGVDLTWVLGNNANLTTSGLTYDLTFEWPAAAHLSGFDPASVAVNYFDPITDWTLPAGETYTNAGGTGPYTDDAFGLDRPPGTSFGMSSSGVLLAIDFLFFKVRLQPEGVQLDWQVMEDQNATAYRIERSRDGHQWQTIHTLAASGVAGEHHYQWVDTDPHFGDNYYRIAGINSDDSYELSAIRQITWEQGQPALTAYPNPAPGTFHLQWNEALNGSTVLVLNPLGQVVRQFTLHPTHRSLTLPAGVYFLNETTLNTILKIVVYE